ncbi:MAG: pilin [Patescibacteria group bacterium]
MKLKYFTNKYLIVILFSLFLNFNIIAVQAAWGPLSDYSDINKQSEELREGAGFQNTGFAGGEGIGAIMATVIQAFLSLLGIIFLFLILIAGYNWMTASGDEEKITKAKVTINRAIIGLIIVISAYAITYFVFNHLPWGTGGEGTGVDYTVD